MADALTIIDRVKSFGANLALDGSGLRIVGRERLPATAIDYIASHRDVLIKALGGEVEEGSYGDMLPPGVVERFPAIDFEVGTPSEWLEHFAKTLTRKRPVGVLESDWQWFLTRCRQIVEEASYLRGGK